jgi:hypothetical protein
MKSRIISGAISLVYLFTAYFVGGPVLVGRTVMFLILPLACIWFSEAMGGYTGSGFFRGAITKTSPGAFVAFGGWLVLSLPVIAGFIMLAR